MDNSTTTRKPQSELLQNRLRDRKAESSRESKREAEEAVGQTERTGRDDDIFLDDEQERHSQKPGARQFQSSPAGPSSWRYDRDSSRTPRSNALSSSTSNTPRAMGVREMQDHIDKLSKQNFDLKMEVFHRRERVEQLERKLRDYPQLEEDLNASLDANDELVAALEARDRAVDEAVVMITDLEQKNAELERQLTEATAAAARKAHNDDGASVPQPPERRNQRTPRKSKDRRSLNNPVSPDVSARMVELAKPSDQLPEPDRIPSFLRNNEPTTAALRSMYVEGDEVVRPIPSHATLLSNVNSEGNDDIMDSGMRSPGLSELSESDLRSIYGRNRLQTSEGDSDESSPVQEKQSLQKQVPQQANARVSRWVADRAISPAKPFKHGNTGTRDVGDGFQSLDNVLTNRQARPQPDAPTRPNTRQPRAPPQEKHSDTPPLPINPVFGQNIFPPTPDTMKTRASNNSTISVVHDTNPFDSASLNSKGHTISVTQSQPQVFASPHPRKPMTTPNSFLPQELDAYDSPPQRKRHAQLDGAQDYGEPLYRAYSSDESYTAEPIRNVNQGQLLSREQDMTHGADGAKNMATAQLASSPTRFIKNGQRPVERTYSTTDTDERPQSHRDHHNTQITWQSDSAIPINAQSAMRTKHRSESNASSMQTPRQSKIPPIRTDATIPNADNTTQPQSQTRNRAVDPSQASVVAASHTMSSSAPLSVKGTKGLAARTASIRNRFSRRKTASSVADTATTPVAATPGSITQRLWFRRSSSEQGRHSISQRDDPTAPLTPSWLIETAPSGPTLPSPNRSKSERHRGSIAITSRSNPSSTSFSSLNGRTRGFTPSEYSGAEDASLSPSSRHRRPSTSGRLGSSHGSVGRGSNTDIPPVPRTPTEYKKWESEPEPGAAGPAASKSKWRFGRSRSNSRSRQDQIWPTTLTGFDGTSAGKRGG